MADTYCGKTCGQCIKKQNNECVGCVAENLGGKSEGCEVARCCKSLHHSSCYKCGTRGTCLNYHAVKTPNALFLSKWIGILFVIMIASVIASFLTLDMTLEVIPGLAVPGFILSVVLSVFYAVVLLVMARTNHSYQLAGVCWIIGQVLLVIGFVIGQDTVGAYVLKIFSLIAGLIAAYNEFDAHANVLNDVDEELVDKWRSLWNITICARLAMICGVGLLFMMLDIGVYLILFASIGMIVADVLKFVYLYKSFKAFKIISGS